MFEVSRMKQVEMIHMKQRGKNTVDVLQSRKNEVLARLPTSEVISVFSPAIGAISAEFNMRFQSRKKIFG